MEVGRARFDNAMDNLEHEVFAAFANQHEVASAERHFGPIAVRGAHLLMVSLGLSWQLPAGLFWTVADNLKTPTRLAQQFRHRQRGFVFPSPALTLV